MASDQAAPPVHGASGDLRNVTTNVASTKRDLQMDTASETGVGTTTGSKAADEVIEQRAADNDEESSDGGESGERPRRHR